jgi:S-adenosylmethionine decarboxylase
MKRIMELYEEVNSQSNHGVRSPRVLQKRQGHAHRGNHVMMDYHGFSVRGMDAARLCERVMEIMVAAIRRCGVRIVHRHQEVFAEGNGVSPPGFASVVLLDESHATAHCYSDKGLLAIDVFSCGAKPHVTRKIASDIDADLRHLLGPSEMERHEQPRFIHRTPIDGPMKEACHHHH